MLETLSVEALLAVPWRTPTRRCSARRTTATGMSTSGTQRASRGSRPVATTPRRPARGRSRAPPTARRASARRRQPRSSSRRCTGRRRSSQARRRPAPTTSRCLPRAWPILRAGRTGCHAKTTGRRRRRPCLCSPRGMIADPRLHPGKPWRTSGERPWAHASAAVRWPHFTAAERPACHEARRFVRRASLGISGPLDGRRCGRRRRDQEKHEHGDRGDDQREKRGTDSGRQGPPPRRHRRLKLPRVVNRADRTDGMPRTGFFSAQPGDASGAAR